MTTSSVILRGVFFDCAEGGPLVWSLSWGVVEEQAGEEYLREANAALMVLAAMGVTVVAASGDNGAPIIRYVVGGGRTSLCSWA